MKHHRYRARNARNIIITAGVAVALFGAIAIGSAKGERFTCDTDPHTVVANDTLWSIAERKCDGNIQVVTDKLVAVYGTTIQSGQHIYLPSNENCSLTRTSDGNIYEECQ